MAGIPPYSSSSSSSAFYPDPSGNPPTGPTKDMEVVSSLKRVASVLGTSVPAAKDLRDIPPVKKCQIENNNPYASITKVHSFLEAWTHFKEDQQIPDSSEAQEDPAKFQCRLAELIIKCFFDLDGTTIQAKPLPAHLINDAFFKQIMALTLEENSELEELGHPKAGEEDKRRYRSWFYDLQNLLKQLHLMDPPHVGCEAAIDGILTELRQDLKFEVYALTSRGPDLRQATLNHLKQCGFTRMFDPKIFHQGDKGPYHNFKPGEEKNKGAQLVSSIPPFEKGPEKQTHIFFVDDSKKHCEDVLDYINGNEAKGIPARKDLVAHVYLLDKPTNPKMAGWEKRSAVIGLDIARRWIEPYQKIVAAFEAEGKDPKEITAADMLAFVRPEEKPLLDNDDVDNEELYKATARRLGIDTTNGAAFRTTLLNALERLSEDLGKSVIKGWRVHADRTCKKKCCEGDDSKRVTKRSEAAAEPKKERQEDPLNNPPRAVGSSENGGSKNEKAPEEWVDSLFEEEKKHQ